MINFYLIFTILLLIKTDNPKNCYEKRGAMVIKIKVMMDEMALSGINSSSPRGFKHFFYKIFDKINKEIQVYGAQFLLDFSEPTTSAFVYDKLKCPEPNPAQTRAAVAMNTLKAAGKVGNRIVIFFCPNNMNSSMSGRIFQDPCNNVMGFLAGNPKTLANTIESKVLDVVFRTSDRGDHFNDNICKFSSDCDGKAWGKYESDLKAIRHIGNDKYLLKQGDVLGEYDLYDDMFLHDYVGKNEKLKKINKN